ncbi:MAG: D-glycero-beta-D-manno-heptose 1-phosphate adenylyltransferase [Candidatus Omnitrophica bacterium]|nr:D-glycero-beta-D-manno-heptose 1-phosphate adenylyltransferase [Candidatus Omnitrophota bacterium]
MLSKKIIKLPALKAKLSRLKKQGKSIAFTNGCFDILHFGHVCYLGKAKKKDSVLVVGLNSDASIRRIKGPSRPINKELERAAVLAALESVDYVIIFEEDTPLNLIAGIKPDILIKGADWKDKGIIGSDIVQKNGGKIEYIDFIDGFSTTALIKKVAGRS